MKIAAFTAGYGPELGVVDGEQLVSITRGAPNLAADMVGLMESWPSASEILRSLTAQASHRLALKDVQLLPPIAKPPKILAIGLNYSDHIGESPFPIPDTQVWFCKLPSAVSGPFDLVQIPAVSNSLDYEVELVFVIGKRGRHISKEQAPAHVFGYCVGNDFSVREWQLATSQWMLGKSFDTHAPFGPWITTADEIDPHNLGVRCLVNRELRQNSNTRHFVYNVWDQVAHLSKAMTLEVGDVIFTGTPSGVGWAFKPPRPLIAGDSVRCEIDGLGHIENICQAET
jgi:2-keto-4-pentenoate hydratase/2-oxohepta-3-ene-1,7-dioic acid hydratase in catechol pathway